MTMRNPRKLARLGRDEAPFDGCYAESKLKESTVTPTRTLQRLLIRF